MRYYHSIAYTVQAGGELHQSYAVLIRPYRLTYAGALRILRQTINAVDVDQIDVTLIGPDY